MIDSDKAIITLRRIKNIARMADARASATRSIFHGDVESLCKEVGQLLGYLRYVEGYELDYAIIHKSQLEQPTP